MLEIIWGLEQKLIFLFHMNQNGAMSGYHDFHMSACKKRLDSTHKAPSAPKNIFTKHCFEHCFEHFFRVLNTKKCSEHSFGQVQIQGQKMFRTFFL